MSETSKSSIILIIAFCLAVPIFAQGKTDTYLQRLDTIISVDLQKNSYGKRYPLAYSVYHICQKVEVPFLYTLSQKHSKTVNQVRIQPIYTTASARRLIIQIAHPLGYRYVVCDEGLYLTPAKNLSGVQQPDIRYLELGPRRSEKPLKKSEQLEEYTIISPTTPSAPDKADGDASIYLRSPYTYDPETAIVSTYTAYPAPSYYYYDGISIGSYYYPSFGVAYYRGCRRYYPYRYYRHYGSSYCSDRHRYHGKNYRYQSYHPQRQYIYRPQKIHSYRSNSYRPGTSYYRRDHRRSGHSYRSRSSRSGTSYYRRDHRRSGHSYRSRSSRSGTSYHRRDHRRSGHSYRSRSSRSGTSYHRRSGHSYRSRSSRSGTSYHRRNHRRSGHSYRSRSSRSGTSYHRRNHRRSGHSYRSRSSRSGSRSSRSGSMRSGLRRRR